MSISHRPDLRQARAGEAARGRGLARSGGAQPLRGTLDATTPTPPSPGCGAGACSASTKRPARWPCSSCRPSVTAVEDSNCATATPTRPSPPRSPTTLARIHAATAADPSMCGRIPDRSHLLRYPAGALPGGDRARASRSRAAPSASWSRRPRPTSTRWCTAMSARRTSCAAPTGRCSSMPNAPGGAIRRSISPSASTTCC